LSDVIAGAGTGILSVELSYLLLPAWNKLLGWERKNRNFAVFHVINRKQAVLSLSYRF
jgi:membrane-associated phospholipid phosphatase